MSTFHELCQVLARKIQLLEHLSRIQEGLRQFLIKPKWSRYFELIQPLEADLIALQTLQQEERSLLEQLARQHRRPKFHALGALLPFLQQDQGDQLRGLMEGIRQGVAPVRRTQILLALLHQAHAAFVTSWVHGIKGLAPCNLYNERGQAIAAETPAQLALSI